MLGFTSIAEAPLANSGSQVYEFTITTNEDGTETESETLHSVSS